MSGRRLAKIKSVKFKNLDNNVLKKVFLQIVLFLLNLNVLYAYSTNFNSQNGPNYKNSIRNIPDQKIIAQNLYNKLTKHEVRHIFGDSVNQVPVSLGLVKLPRRRAQEIEKSHKKHENDQIVTFDGLDRSFHISLRPNGKNLIDHNFVHLIRHGDDKREILSRQIVQKKMDCFHHGLARIRDQTNFNDEKLASVSLDICDGGLRGFMVPHDPSDAHYVIHPVPERLSGQNEHFIWRKSDERQRKKRDTSTTDGDDGNGCHHEDLESFPQNIRQKRSPTSSLDHNSGYRPQNIAPDSYWYQLRPSTPSSSSSSRIPKTFYFNEKPNSALPLDDQYFEGSTYPSSKRGGKTIVIYDDESLSGGGAGDQDFDSDDPDDISSAASSTSGQNYYFQNQKKPLQYSSPYSYEGGGVRNRIIFPLKTWRPMKEQTYFFFHGHKNNSVALRHTHKNPAIPSKIENFRNSRYDESIFGKDWKSTMDNRRPLPSQSPIPVPPRVIDEIDPYYPAETKTSTDSFLQRRSNLNNLLQSVESQSQSLQSISKENYKELEGLSQIQKPLHLQPALKQLTIETAVFVDKDLFKHMETNFPEDTQGEVTRIVLAMINGVQLLYQDPSLGYKVDFVLKRLEVLKTDPPGLLRPYDIDRFLTNFCKWQKTENPPSDDDDLHWDHALILTGLDLYVVHSSGKISNQVVGLAPVSGMCTQSSSCTVNEGRHFESVYVVAHEIGHNLGMRHDGIGGENDCDPTSSIMSPTLGSGKITWSECSRKYLDLFMETSQSKCLLDRATSESKLDHDADGRLPGERFDADKQCVLKYGRGSFHADQQTLEDVCRDLHCRKEHYTWTSHPALEGTFCGHDLTGTKICRAGKCVLKISNSILGNFDYNSNFNSLSSSSETAYYSSPKAIDGGWGKWSSFTDCSSICIDIDDNETSPITSSVGIRLAARRCDSPRPANGGRQCNGLDRRYKTCPNTKICSIPGSRTTISEYANVVCTRAASTDGDLNGQGYMMTNTDDPEKACQVWCDSKSGSRSRGWSFPDGTSCQLSSQPNSQTYCVAGKCQEFFCDAYSLFSLSDDECSPYKTNKIPNAHGSNDNDLFGISDNSNWVSSTYTGHGPGPGDHGRSRDGKSVSLKNSWTTWSIQSDCKISCLALAKGLELVQRECIAGLGQCSEGSSVSVRLCKPNKNTILQNGCSRLQTPFEFATKICTKYAEKISGLSGIGMQLSPTENDINRSCRIGCQDQNIPYRFFMVNGEEGWFPAGTDCSRGDSSKKAFCLGGKCLNFGDDDTPAMIHIHHENLTLPSFESIFTPHISSSSSSRSKRQVILGETYNLMEDQHQNRKTSNADQNLYQHVIDFNRPITVGHHHYQHQQQYDKYPKPHFTSPYNHNDHGQYYKNHVYSQKPYEDQTILPSYSLEIGHHSPSSLKSPSLSPPEIMEGSFYEWKRIESDCSKTCGTGIKEIIVQCISGDTQVSDLLCPKESKPGSSAYLQCTNPPCSGLNDGDGGDLKGRSLFRLIQSLIKSNYTVNQS